MRTEDIVLRIFLSIILGGIFGAERTLKKKPAGFITLSLVSLGATLVAILQLELVEVMDANKGDIARLTAQVISGVGFIGGGTIVYNKGSIHGITTAALLWVSACVGLAVGYGFYRLSLISFVGILIVLFIMRWIEKHYIRKVNVIVTHLKLHDKKYLTQFMERYQDSIGWDDFQIKDIKPVKSEEGIVECSFMTSEKINFENLERKLLETELVSEIKLMF